MPGWRLEHTYAELPQLFYSRVVPTPVRDPQMVVFNTALAERLGLDVAGGHDTPYHLLLAGNALPDGARPIAQAYAGHQFGHFTGLGDGRAILLGEQITPSGERFDIQLKGAGQTPYSRRGDGRAALGPMLREYIVSEAMHGLGIPTTRSLAVVKTGEMVFREQPLEGAVLTRVAASHIRVGTMEWAAAHRDEKALAALSDHTRKRHYPDLPDTQDTHFALFTAIVERQARLIAQWQLVGFIHGVMNTDNMALSGETIDYGPCAFMDVYDPETVFSSIDHGGRYAYGNQPPIAQWNLARLAEAMLPLFGSDQERAAQRATEALHQFAELFERYFLEGMRAKLGLFDEHPEDKRLIDDLLALMHQQAADYTNTFRTLTGTAVSGDGAPDDRDFRAWVERLRVRWGAQTQSAPEVHALMRRSNPAFIPRNHKVEEALAAATTGDLSVMEQLLDVLRTPYDHDRVAPEFIEPGQHTMAYRTFCGT